MSQSPILRPMDKSSEPTVRYSTLLRSDCMMLLTQKEASGSRNYPMRSGAAYSTVQANGTIEDHVWFEDRWMVTSLCDE
jgi:hypothetical protein